MSECSTDISLAEDLFGLVEQSAVFLSDSHKRMETWTSITSVKHTGHDKLIDSKKSVQLGGRVKIKLCLQLWIYNVVEIDKEVDNAKFTTLLTFLTTVCHGNFNSQSKFIAKSLISNWTRFEIICISNLLLDIYSATTPVSIYLQTKTINYLQAWNMIAALKK